LSQRRALVAVGPHQVADCIAAGPRPDPPPEAPSGVPDPARTARHAVPVRTGPPGTPARHGGRRTHRVTACARGARIRELPRRRCRVGRGQGAVARREKACSARAPGAPAALPARDRAAAELAAAAHALAAGATRVVRLAETACGRFGRPTP